MKNKLPLHSLFLTLMASTFFCYQCQVQQPTSAVQINKESHIVLIGNNLGSRMMNFGHFETEMHLRFPDSLLFIRNMCDGGNTPGFRPHSGRVSPWAFPGAERYQSELAQASGSQGHFETPDEWLSRLKADVIIAFFGFNESFQGEEGLDNYKAELDDFIIHTQNQSYSKSSPQLVIVSPIAFQNLSAHHDLPDGIQENKHLELYANAMKEVAANRGVIFIDAFSPSNEWFAKNTQLTSDGSQLNDKGYQIFSKWLVDQLFGKFKNKAEKYRSLVHDAVKEKNWFWHNDYKIPNGVHVFGRRYEPFGPDNYPGELKKIREMTSLRDQAIWKAAKGEIMDLESADKQTSELQTVKTNYDPDDNGRGETRYLYGQDALDQIQVAPGYKIELFASEKEFKELANPVQLSFDNKGRLWVAVMPTYPHYKPGDQKPNDKLIILEDTDGDYKADKLTTFVEGLHIPTGFEFAPEGVYIAQGTNLKLYSDTDGDDKADTEEIILSGFDDHDSHHVISAFCADPSGAIYMGEGVFLHTNVETSYGPVRGTNGGFYRYNPQRRQLERTAQLSIPNPWGIAFDEWGQHFFAETSGPDVRWMLPGSVKPRYGVATHKSFNLIEDDHRVRPTSGLEFVSSRHFPDEVQGDLLINNTIGFLGTKQHAFSDDGTGYTSKHRQDLISSTDKNFRPVDMEFAPDGSLYLVDWHNVLIGHMQHNARDPLRDHVHGRIYRISYPSRPLVTPAKVTDASIEELLDNLKLHEYRTRYRTKRELRGRNPEEVLSSLEKWKNNLDASEINYEHHLLEALWVTWGLNQTDGQLLHQLLKSSDHRVRSAAVRVLHYTTYQIPDYMELLLQTAEDDHGRVRLETIIAASKLEKENGLKILDKIGKLPLDDWTKHAHETALAHLNDRKVNEPPEEPLRTHLLGKDRDLFFKGKEIYERDGYCTTCHQEDGKGLLATGTPPLTGTRWVLGNEERLIKLVLKGLYGPIEILGNQYPGAVPMTPYEGLLNDEELAAVLTYVRNHFGNKASPVSPSKVAEIRNTVKGKEGFYKPEELLSEHPLDN